MNRAYNTTRTGGGFTPATLRLVWTKGLVAPGYHPAEFRQDRCGALMEYAQHGNIDSPYGWEVDHIRPAALGGGDELANLQPLQWRNNRQKGDSYLCWTCAVP
jgi:hypothetical protein